MTELDPETEKRIDEPVAREAERETLLTPSQATERMRIKVPPRANKKLRTLVERVNADPQLKGWWHVANVNAVKRLEINDHSWVHIQIVANIALKLLRQLAKRDVEPAMVADYGMEQEDSEVVVVLAHDLHQEVEGAAHDDDVVDLRDGGDGVGGGAQVPLDAQPEHRHAAEAERERVGHRDDLADT